MSSSPNIFPLLFFPDKSNSIFEITEKSYSHLADIFIFRIELSTKPGNVGRLPKVFIFNQAFLKSIQ